jgi:hypothetical protein
MDVDSLPNKPASSRTGAGSCLSHAGQCRMLQSNNAMLAKAAGLTANSIHPRDPERKLLRVGLGFWSKLASLIQQGLAYLCRPTTLSILGVA